MKRQYKMKTPVGSMFLVASKNGLHGVYWSQQEYPFTDLLGNEDAEQILKQAISQLNEYFQGLRSEFELPLNPEGTNFQMKVWGGLSAIPYGHTQSYKELATSISNSKASRAVGGANGKNPLSIIIPCHRVISSDGTLGGYAGGLKAKEWLLRLEGAL